MLNECGCSTLESPHRHEGRTPCLRVPIKAFRNRGSLSCANWIRRCTRKFVWIAWADLSSRWYTGSRGRQKIWTSLEIAPKEIGRSILELGMRGGLLHQKYKIYLDHVGIAPFLAAVSHEEAFGTGGSGSPASPFLTKPARKSVKGTMSSPTLAFSRASI